METSKNEMVRTGIGTSETETAQYFNSTLLQYYLIGFVVNSHVEDPWQSQINDNFGQYR